jgi:hypothetical protein
MTNEEIQRTMEFIIKGQESFSENMGRMLDLHGQSEKRISRLETATVQFYNASTELSRAEKALNERMAEPAEAQAHTDRRVNALIDIIDRRRNGESQA